MKKNKILSMFICALFVVNFTNVLANDESKESEIISNEEQLNVVAGIDKRYELPLTLEVDKPIFYLNSNLSPGDEIKTKIIFENPTSEPIQFNIIDIENLKEDNELSNELLSKMDFELTIDNSPIYKGLAIDITNPLMGWIEIQPNNKVELDVRYAIHKNADNRFQNVDLNLKYVFSIRADVPEDPIEEDFFEELIDTSVNAIQSNTIPIFIVVSCAITFIFYKRKKK